MNRIPVSLPGGELMATSPAGQSLLLKSMIEDLCGHFTPGGDVVFVADPDASVRFSTGKPSPVEVSGWSLTTGCRTS